MKRIPFAILLIVLTLSVFGCSKKKKTVESPVSFYYCISQSEYETADAVIQPEVRDAKGFENDITSLLNTYFHGPESKFLLTPFPDGTCIESLVHIENTYHITLNSRFARLSGLDLTMACACLSKTIMEYTGCSSVTIYAFDASLDGNPSITITKDSLMLDNVSVGHNEH